MVFPIILTVICIETCTLSFVHQYVHRMYWIYLKVYKDSTRALTSPYDVYNSVNLSNTKGLVH